MEISKKTLNASNRLGSLPGGDGAHYSVQLLEKARTDTDAVLKELGSQPSGLSEAEAVALFCYQAKKWVGAFAAVLGGLDTLVFSAGIGENCPSIRARICDGLGFLGIELNESRNAETAGVISTDASRATVRVIRTDEELMIARSVWRVERTALGSKAIEGATE
jgi:acetate kinase